jgi:lipid kinase YegS
MQSRHEAAAEIAGETLQIALIAKPKDPSTIKELRDAVKWLRSQGHTVHPRLTFDGDDAIRLARLATRRGVDLVIAAGGDGTVNEVVNGIARTKAERKPSLAIVPLGTANDFAKGLQLPPTVREAVEIAVHGTAVDVDVALVNGRCFVNVSTGGFGPDITEESSSKAKARFGKLAYLFTAVRKLASLQPMHAVFETDAGVLYEGPFFFFAVGNARHTGGGTPVTPMADYSDAQLDLAIVTGDKRRNFLSLLPDLRSGKHPDDADVLYVKTREVRVRALDKFAVNADGEPLEGTKFHYKLLGQRVNVMRTYS